MVAVDGGPRVGLPLPGIPNPVMASCTKKFTSFCDRIPEMSSQPD